VIDASVALRGCDVARVLDGLHGVVHRAQSIQDGQLERRGNAWLAARRCHCSNQAEELEHAACCCRLHSRRLYGSRRVQCL
jgi:hypothetical protein